MAALGQLVDNEVDPSSLKTPIPEGEYLAIVAGSEVKRSTNGQSEYIDLTLQIVQGKHEKRLLWDKIHTKNESKKAIDMATLRADEYSQACGLPRRATDSAQWHDIPLVIKVAVYEDEYQGEKSLKNKITKIRSRSGKPPAPSGQTQGAPWAGGGQGGGAPQGGENPSFGRGQDSGPQSGGGRNWD